MSKHSVVINGDTTGTVDTETMDGQHPDAFIGEYITIKAQDENGLICEHYGKLTDVLD